MQTDNTKKGLSTRVQRALILATLIVIVTFFWVWTLLYTNLAAVALTVIGLLSLLLLSLATAWTAMAFPSRSKS